VLYVVYWGIHEPLGRSLVMPAVRKMSAQGVRIDLVTFEKAADLGNQTAHRNLAAELAKAGVIWRPLRYHKRPKWPATAFDVLQGVWTSARLARAHAPDLVHARTFVGGVVGLALKRIFGLRLVYHNEGFYPDEQVDGGFWRAGSFPHRTALALERAMYRSADGIMVLSQRARAAIEGLPEMSARRTAYAVVPSCVDLSRFASPQAGSSGVNGILRLVYLGSLGGRYRLDWLVAFVSAVARLHRDTRVLLLTPARREPIAQAFRDAGVREGSWSIDTVPHSEVPSRLAGQNAGLFFLTRGLSEHGCSPTKIGEYWAAGLPVVTSGNIGDIEAIVIRERVGVVIADSSRAACDAAAAQLLSLLQDPALPSRCRAASEAHYSLDRACEAQRRLYESLSSAGRL
jgi:glycosyltransferase involved in cell wall biosynthesis